jgi:hypothetical protein
MWIGYTPIAKDVYVGGYRWNVFQTASTNAVFVPTANQVDVDDANLNLMDFIDEIVRRTLGILAVLVPLERRVRDRGL